MSVLYNPLKTSVAIEGGFKCDDSAVKCTCTVRVYYRPYLSVLTLTLKDELSQRTSSS